jgi:hypothetical protein
LGRRRAAPQRLRRARFTKLAGRCPPMPLGMRQAQGPHPPAAPCARPRVGTTATSECHWPSPASGPGVRSKAAFEERSPGWLSDQLMRPAARRSQASHSFARSTSPTRA